MKKDLTELVFILDMSGSMDNLTADTIGGFNSTLKSQMDGEGEVLVTTYLFNNTEKLLHDRLPIEEVRPLTDREYRPSGCTALVDTIGTAIHHISQIHRYARPEDVPAHTLFVITTDGLENASRKYTAADVRRMITHEKEKYGWEFIFLAENIDAVETARMYGIDESRAVNTHADPVGAGMKYAAVEKAVFRARRSMSLDDMSWREDADADFKKRK